MGILQAIVKGMGKNKAEFKAKLKDAQESKKIEDLIEERSRSSNERDLLKRLEQKRQERIKGELDKLRKQDNSNNWKGNLLNSQTSILKSDKPDRSFNVLRNNEKLFKGKSLFFQ